MLHLPSGHFTAISLMRFSIERRGVGHDEAMIVGLAEGNAVQFLVHAHKVRERRLSRQRAGNSLRRFRRRHE